MVSISIKYSLSNHDKLYISYEDFLANEHNGTNHKPQTKFLLLHRYILRPGKLYPYYRKRSTNYELQQSM
jgi:hypothetical protein